MLSDRFRGILCVDHAIRSKEVKGVLSCQRSRNKVSKAMRHHKQNKVAMLQKSRQE